MHKKPLQNSDNLTVPYCPSCLPPTITQKDPRLSTSSSSWAELLLCLCLLLTEDCSSTLLSAPRPSPFGRTTGTSGFTTLQTSVQTNTLSCVQTIQSAGPHKFSHPTFWKEISFWFRIFSCIIVNNNNNTTSLACHKPKHQGQVTKIRVK